MAFFEPSACEWQQQRHQNPLFDLIILFYNAKRSICEWYSSIMLLYSPGIHNHRPSLVSDFHCSMFAYIVFCHFITKIAHRTQFHFENNADSALAKLWARFWYYISFLHLYCHRRLCPKQVEDHVFGFLPLFLSIMASSIHLHFRSIFHWIEELVYVCFGFVCDSKPEIHVTIHYHI